MTSLNSNVAALATQAPPAPPAPPTPARVGNLLRYDELDYAVNADPVKCELCGVWLYTPKIAECTYRQCWACHTAAHEYALKALDDARETYLNGRLSRYKDPQRLNRAALRRLSLDAHYAMRGIYERAMMEYKTLAQTGQLAMAEA